MSKVLELFGYSTHWRNQEWQGVINGQQCPFIGATCYKVRKSDPTTSIGTCTVSHGREANPVLICPARMLERRQIFTDCLHLLQTHEPGNELHIVSEISVPGGNVDYFVVSARDYKVLDFVGVEIQTVDTTGTVWPERQRVLKEMGVPRQDTEEHSLKSFGMNWKMTAKTILMQLHHKIQTFENVNRKLVLVVQDKLLQYMSREFDFEHLKNPATMGDSMHFHVYRLERQQNDSFKLALDSRLSTDVGGVNNCLGLNTEANVELDQIIHALEQKISPGTIFAPL